MESGGRSALLQARSVAFEIRFPYSVRRARLSADRSGREVRVAIFGPPEHVEGNDECVRGERPIRVRLHGTNCTVDATCSGSLAAVDASVNELVLGQADLMISGGVDACNNPMTFLGFSKTPALSATSDCRPFSEAADGTILGEGVGMVALKRLADAEHDGDRIRAVIKGIGSSSDGRGPAIYAPSATGQVRALTRAYERAGHEPSTVELVEAHGTGTRAGDAAEFATLREVFAAEHVIGGWCALGSVKSQIGHTKAAAGAGAMVKTALALQHKQLLPTIKIGRPNPAMTIDASPFYLNTRTRPWVRAAGHPRQASVTNSGFGGSNFHVAMQEYVPRGAGRAARRIRTMPAELVLLSAESLHELAAVGAGLLGQGPIEQIAAQSQRTFDRSASCRLALVLETGEEFDRLERALAGITGSQETELPLSKGVPVLQDLGLDSAFGVMFMQNIDTRFQLHEPHDLTERYQTVDAIATYLTSALPAARTESA